MTHSNTSGTQDEYIKEAATFSNSLMNMASLIDENHGHIDALIEIITELDDKLSEAKRLLDNNEISYDL